MVRFLRIVFPLFAALTICAGAALAVTPYDIYEGSKLRQVVKKGKLVVGMELKFWPFEYTDEQGRPMGLDVDIARAIADALGVELEIKDMEWTGLIPALASDKIDIIISGITGTLERAKTITFTRPYFVTGLCALTSAQKAADVNDIGQLDDPNRIIAVKTGTTADLVATKRFPKAQINRFKDETSCAQEVVNGRADAFFYDQISVAKHHKQNPETTRALLEPFTFEPYCIALQKGDFDWWQWLEMFLETAAANGTLKKIHARHLGDILPQ